MNVNYNGNENSCEAIIKITFPCKHTVMKHDINKFNLTQFECRIQKSNLLTGDKEKAEGVFPASVILNITNQSRFI